MKKEVPNQLIKAHIFVSGRVQGVFYRLHTEKQARKLGISGWVRNRTDGRVEAVIVGPEEKIKQMINWLWQGSPLSKVEEVKIVSQKLIKKDPFQGQFGRRPTFNSI